MSTNRATSWPMVRLYALAFLFFSANSILTVIIPIRSEGMGASNTMIGLIMGTYMLTCMLFRPWAGYFVHKYGPNKVLRVLLVIHVAALLLYPFVGFEGFFAARLMQGVATAFFSMALQIGIIDALSDEERSQGVSLYSLFTYMPSIAGPLIAFGIWEWGEMNAFTAAMIAIAVMTGLFGASTSMQQPSKEQPVEQSDSGEKGNRWRGWGRMLTQPELVVCSTLMLSASVVFGAVTVFIPLYASQVLHGNAGVYLMMQAGVIVLARYLLRKRVPSDGLWRPRYVAGILLLAATAALLLSVSTSVGLPALYVSAVLMGIAQALLYPTLMTFLTFVLPSSSRNVLIGLFIASADLGISLGGVAMGPLADSLSYAGMYAVCSGLAVTMAGLAALYRRRLVKPGSDHTMGGSA